jgi:membrane protease subunit HflC
LSKKAIVGVILIILVLIGMRTVLFTVDETEQAIIVQLGRYVRTVQEPGLHFKMPLVQETVRNEFGAQARLDDIVFSEIREELARHTLTEIISLQREAIMDTVGNRCDEKAREYRKSQ